MSPSAVDSAAARLCGACGLCCNGVLFHTVRLQPGDSPRELAALGLRLKPKNQKILLLQPCPAFRDQSCAIYPQRPTRCRLFECRQLQKVNAGLISEEAALEKIREVQRRVTRLEQLALRTDGRPRKGPLSQRCETALAEPFDSIALPELIAQREELARGMNELEDILDADFRVT